MPSRSRSLRLSGLFATSVFFVVAVSDLLLLTRLDVDLPHRFWDAAPTLPAAQVEVGYLLGVLAWLRALHGDSLEPKGVGVTLRTRSGTSTKGNKFYCLATTSSAAA